MTIELYFEKTTPPESIRYGSHKIDPPITDDNGIHSWTGEAYLDEVKKEQGGALNVTCATITVYPKVIV